MKKIPPITIIALVLFLLSLLYFLINVLNKDLTLQGNTETQYTSKDHEYLKPENRQERIQPKQFNEEISQKEFDKFKAILIKDIENTCKVLVDEFNQYDDLMDRNSKLYENPRQVRRYLRKVTDKINFLNEKIYNNHKSAFVAFTTKFTGIKVQDFFDIEFNFLGCGTEENVGIFTMTFVESLHKKGIDPSFYITDLTYLASLYLEFESFQGLYNAYGVMASLTINPILKGHLKEDVESLKQEIDELIFQLTKDLESSESDQERLSILRTYAREKTLLKEKMEQVIHSVKARYPQVN